MVGFKLFGLLAAFLALFLNIALAVPTAGMNGPVRQIPNQIATFRAADGLARGRRHGPLEYHRTLSKYNIPIPKGLQNAVNRYAEKLPVGGTGGVPAASQQGDLEWLSPADIGTPPQRLSLDFDTGSADTWVFTNDTATKSVKGQTIFDVNNSTTATLVPNCTWNIMYGDFSSSSGIVYKDTFALGDLVIKNMTIESAKQVSSQFSNQKEMSGLVGLAFNKLIETKPKQRSLTDFLSEVLQDPIFTTDLRHNSSEGTYNFGFIDRELHNSDIQYVDVDSTDGYWGVLFKGFAAKDSSDYSYEFAEPPTVILDTGSTLFYAPDDAVTSFYKNHVPLANFSYSEYGWILPCNSTPPSFIWELTDKSDNVIQGEVPGDYLPYAVLDTKGSPEGYCYSGLQSLGSFSALQGILGDVFLKSNFQVWNVVAERIGFAPKPLPPMKSRSLSGNGKWSSTSTLKEILASKNKKVIL
ncbi:aspartic peptidase domain-containing protein [Pestalotiopsis sp. NC0098]|nr:aspartic peptidase domain-containing protein [Pestalotiopsis sp. NC0098]